MFSKAKPQQTTTVRSSGQPVPPSIISSNLVITGNLESDGDIQLDGQINGDVRTNNLTVGEHAVVNGGVVAKTVMVAGTVNGEIKAEEVELVSSAKVTGDITHGSLSIQAGAFLQGLCKRLEDDVPVGEAIKPNDSNLKAVGGKDNMHGKPAASDKPVAAE